MGLNHSPRIVTDGLVLSLDAGNIKSYDYYENIVGYSNAIGGTGYSLVNALVTTNTTAVVAPDGTYAATLIDQNGNSNNYVYGSNGAFFSLVANTVYTYSIHIKQASSPNFWVTIDEGGFGGKRYYVNFTYATEAIATGVTGLSNDGVVLDSAFERLPNGWYRLSITFRTSTTTVNSFVDMIARFSTAGTHYVWGRQLERGYSASPFTPTTTVAKTRGTSLKDLSVRTNTGSLFNSISYNARNRGCFVFDGVDDYILANDTSLNSAFSSTDVSLFTWVYPTSAGQVVVELGQTGINTAWHDTNIEVSSSGVFSMSVWHNSLTNRVTSQQSLNGWYHVGFTYSGTTFTGYVNGVAVGTATLTRSAPYYNGRQTHYALGAIDSQNMGTNSYLGGRIASFSVYNRGLSQNEVIQNFNSLRGRYGL